MREIKESDWKLLRELHDVALERFCQRVLGEVQRRSAASKKSYHERYLEICRLLKRRDRELADSFNGLRRSTAVQQLTVIHSQGLLSEEEFARFSPETRSAVDSFLAIVRD
jgi:hypothetical protein